MSSLLTPVRSLKGIGPVLAERFAKLGIVTLEDALLYFPFRHEDWRNLRPIAEAETGAAVTLRVEVEAITSRRSWKRRQLTITEARVVDQDGTALAVTWFNIPYLSQSIPSGTRIFLSGTIELKDERLTMVNPTFEKVSAEPAHQLLVPIYRTTEGISQRQLRNVIKHAVEFASLVPDHLPLDIRRRFDFPDRPTALQYIHFPPSPEAGELAIRRLQFDELLAWQVRWQQSMDELRQRPAPVLPFDEQRIRLFVQRLSFELTNDQRLAAWNIFQHLGSGQPMSALLQGDVGTGKTVVAALSALTVLRHHHQVVLLAPTTILAQQHAETFRTFFAQEDYLIVMATGQGWKATYHGRAWEEIDRQEAAARGQLFIGTHALLEDDLAYPALGLIIVDEQQRFGVAQRHILDAKATADGQTPHFLSMTATPIPRTFQLVMSEDLTMVRLTHFPKPRVVETKVILREKRDNTIRLVKQALKKKEQVFVITPLIEESDDIPARAAISEYERWKKLLPGFDIGLVHGRQPAEDREATMQKFRSGDIHLLVGTTVIEVGIDIPNATTMVIENAERFGLAQLHQLRGRIARHGQQGLCLLVAGSSSTSSLERLEVVAKNTDGLVLAEEDHRRRGPGEVYGVQQSGLPQFRMATLDDHDLFLAARDTAKHLIAAHAETAILMDEEWAQPPTIHRE